MLDSSALDDPGVAEIKATLDAGMDVLRGDASQVSQAMLAAARMADPRRVPVGAVTAITKTRRHLSALRGRLNAIQTSHAAKPLVLDALGYFVQALTSFERALDTRDPVKSDQLTASATASFTRARRVFLEADRALGCVYGCKPLAAPPPKPRR
jgi:hypothetical protein